MSWYLTAMLMGLAGSLHCLGMCGPIFVTTSTFYNSPKEFLFPTLLHHFGKLISYAALGLALGFIGKSVSLIWFQNQVLIVCGLILIIMAVAGLVRWKALDGFNQWIGRQMSRLLKQKKGGSLLLGIINGLIPCGLVYAAAVGAVATQSPTDGVLFMVFFGLGTMPSLLAAGFSRWLLPLRKFKNINIWKQIPVLLLGILLLLKGLSLGIPYISPDLNSHKPTENCCRPHHK